MTKTWLQESLVCGKQNRRPSLVVNAISNWSALGVNIVIGFLLTPYIIACLGTSNYGIWVLVGSVIGYYGVLDLGVRSAVMRYAARYAGAKDHKALNQVVNGAIAMFCGVGALVVISTFLGSAPLAIFFNIKAEDFISFKQVMWLLGLSAGLMFPGSVLTVVMMAHERFVITNIAKIIADIIRGCLTFLVLYQGGTLVHVSWVYLGLSVCEILVNVFLIKVYFKHVSFSLKLIKKKVVLGLLNFGFFAFIGRFGELLRLKLDTAVIGRFLNIELVGVYGLASFLLSYMFRLVVASVGVTQPRLSSLAGRVDNKALSQVVMKYSIITANLAACFVLVAILLGRDFIKLFVPENFKDPNGAALVLIILLVGLIPDLMTKVSINALQAVKKHRFYAYQTIIEGIANLILSIMLVVPFGIYGVALGTAIPALVTKLIIQPIYCCRILQISWGQYMFNVLVKPLLVVGSIVLWYNSNINFTAKTYPPLFLKGAVIFLLYSIIAYMFCLDEESRQLIKEKLKRFPAIMGAKAE